MKKKYSSLLIALTLFFSGITIAHAEEEISEESVITEETSTSTPAEIVTEESEIKEILDLPTTEATLRIETITGGEIFHETITVTACKPYGASEEYTLNAKCLIDQAEGLASTWNFFGTDAFLDSVNGISNDFGANLFWGYFINSEYASVALNAYTLTEGDEVLLVYGINPLKIEMDNLVPTLYTTTTLHVYEFGLDESWNPVWLLANSSTIIIDGVEITTSENGTADITFTNHSEHTIQATKEGFAKSNTLTIETALPTIEARLYAVTHDNILFDDTMTVTACKPTTESEEYTLNAQCLIDQAEGVDAIWNYYGNDTFLDSVNGYSNDFLNNLFWGYFINSEYGSVALNNLILDTDDEILINYNTIPLKLEFSTTTPTVGNSIAISVYEFGLDASWNPIWLPSTSSTLDINGESHILETNAFDLNITTTSPYTITVSKSGYITIKKIIVAGEIVVPTTPPTTGGGGGGGSCCNTTDPAQNMINFLDAKQNSDGSFGSSAFLSDWAAVAYGAWEGSSSGKNKLETYLSSDPSPLDGPNKTTNYARRAMALMSLGLNPYTGTATNYIEKILSSFDGNQFGDVGLINDDIFALVPLLRAGYSYTDARIASTTKYILANQNVSGSFGSIDLTAAAIQALAPLSTEPGVQESLVKAKNYLAETQATDGGFGNVYATSWSIQGIVALDEELNDWKKGNNSPKSYITNNQAVDGGLLLNDSNSNRIWSTSYAIPALLEKPWYTILSSFSSPSGNGSSEENISADQSTSSTTQTVSSTPILITTPTSTPITTTTLEVEAREINPIVITTANEPDTEEFMVVSRETNTDTTVLGDRIEEEVPTTTSVITKVIPETTENTESIAANQNASIKKYVFGISLAGLVVLLGYALWSSKKS